MELAWTIISVVVVLLVGVGVSMLGLSPPEFTIARFFFWFSSVLLGGLGIFWAIRTEQSTWWRITASVAIWLCIGIGLPETLRWVTRRERAVLVAQNKTSAEPKKPSSGLSQVAPPLPLKEPQPTKPLKPKVAPSHTHPSLPEQTPVPSVTVSAPNGIAIGGGTVTNPVLNNYGDPNPYHATVTWFPDGIRKTSLNSSINFFKPYAVSPVDTMFQMQEAKSWVALKSWSEDQRKLYPDFFLLDMSYGLASLNLCLKEDGLRELRKFIEETKDATEWTYLRSEAIRILQQARQLSCPMPQ